MITPFCLSMNILFKITNNNRMWKYACITLMWKYLRISILKILSHDCVQILRAKILHKQYEFMFLGIFLILVCHLVARILTQINCPYSIDISYGIIYPIWFSMKIMQGPMFANLDKIHTLLEVSKINCHS